ncbi:MAG: LamG domain-containing protein [Bacteroidota bacterium]
MSFWINVTLAQKDNSHAVGVLALASSTNFWGNFTWYADNTTKGPSDSMDLKIYFRNGTADNWDFAGYTGTARWPHMYDGQWHHIAFTYDAAASTGTLYRDGVQFDQKTNETIAFDGNASQLVVGGFEQAANIQGDYAGNTWMAGFPGKIDNIRLYGEALSASDINALYTNKQ